MSPEEMAAAIVRGDIDRLDAMPDVGRKVAERVVRKLSERVAELKLAVSESRAGPSDSSAQVLDDAVWALVNLGYKRAEAEVGGRFPRRLCRRLGSRDHHPQITDGIVR